MKKEMKTIMFTLAFMLVLPISTWQTWNPNTGILTVYSTKYLSNDICQEGLLEDYDGTCTSPSVPTRQYIEKVLRLRKEN